MRRHPLRRTWPPLPGATCLVAGHVGRYIGNNLGAYLVFTREDGSFISDPSQRPVRIYRATEANFDERQTAAISLPTNQQLELVIAANGLRHPLTFAGG